jgi:D-alanyl-D-alanine carboxypeptidase/D-alanyl-D-alanine-endopeptidase (penicillin-binding protein 4)
MPVPLGAGISVFRVVTLLRSHLSVGFAFMIRVGVVVAVWLCLAGFAQAQVDSAIRSALAAPGLARATAGVEVVRLGPTRADDRIVFSNNGDTPLIPASNQKILTSVTALDRLGPDFKFRTLLLRRGNELAFVGDGDPTLGDSAVLKPVGWEPTTLFREWARILQQQGVTRVDRLLYDDGVFDRVMLHPAWPVEQSHLPYVPQVGGINFNANCLDVYVAPRGGSVEARMDPATSHVVFTNTATPGRENKLGLVRMPGTNTIKLSGTVSARNTVPWRVTINDPPAYGATVLAETLRSSGIEVRAVDRDPSIRPTLVGSQDHGWIVVAAFETGLMPIIRQVNKESNNLYAEALCKRLGAVDGASGSWESGTQAMYRLAMSAGAREDALSPDDGSGMSRNNRVSASTLAAVLAHVFHSPNRDAFLGTLAVGGEDGTLSRRFRGELAGRVFAKTGYIRGVSTLSGFVQTRSGDWYAFSILFNNLPDGGVSAARQAQERIVDALDRG